MSQKGMKVSTTLLKKQVRSAFETHIDMDEINKNVTAFLDYMEKSDEREGRSFQISALPLVEKSPIRTTQRGLIEKFTMLGEREIAEWEDEKVSRLYKEICRIIIELVKEQSTLQGTFAIESNTSDGGLEIVYKQSM